MFGEDERASSGVNGNEWVGGCRGDVIVPENERGESGGGIGSEGVSEDETTIRIDFIVTEIERGEVSVRSESESERRTGERVDIVAF
jgi:hypothetical protein